MLFIHASHISPRLQYSLEIIFKIVLQIPFQIIQEEETEASPLLEYGDKKHKNSFFVPSCGLLAERNMERRQITDFLTEAGEDVFSKVFWYVTEYEKQSNPIYDKHGRYDEVGSHSNVTLRPEPMVHIWCEALWMQLKTKFPTLKRGIRSYQGLITYDLDHPWKYLNKGLAVSLGSIAKRLLKGKWKEVQEQFKSIITGNDPNFTFDEIFHLSPPEKTIFFCLIGRKSPHDSRFTYQHEKLRKLIRNLINKGYQVGIHPSYTTFQDGNQLQFEVKQLQAITETAVIHSRQHFLRYRLPETFRYLLDAGIQHDYTLGLYSEIGFRTGMAIPYPWFDLAKNERTELMLHPTLAMDRSLQAYMGLTPEKALGEIETLVDKVKAVNGTFTLLLHNDSLSESGEWEGWRASIGRMIQAVLNDE